MLTWLAVQDFCDVCFLIQEYLSGRKDAFSGDSISTLSRGSASFVLCSFLQFQGRQLDKAVKAASHRKVPPSLLSSLSLSPLLSSPTIFCLFLLFSPFFSSLSLLYRDKFSLYSPGWPNSCNPPASASAALSWQVFVTTHSSRRHFLMLVYLLISQIILT